jgi:hypothetical protein
MDNTTQLYAIVGTLVSLIGVLTLFAQNLYNGISLTLLFLTALLIFTGFGFLFTAAVMDYINEEVVE